jgi:N4-gp56 family major capsid protein
MALNINLTSTSGLPNAVANYYDRNLLDRLEADLYFEQYGEQKSLPKGKGNVIYFTRYSNLSVSTTALTQGTVPDGLTLQSTQITATPVQYGNYIALSDMLRLQSIDPIVEGALDVLGYLASLQLDTVIRNTLHNAMTNQFAGGAVSEVTTSAVFTAAEVRKAVKTLKVANVRPHSEGTYAGLIHPTSGFDLMSETVAGGWLEVNKYTSADKMMKGEIGKLYGVRFAESTNIQTGTGASSAVSYRNWIFGKGAFGVVSLDGMALKTYIKQLGSSGVSDPLDQISTVGYKYSHVTKVLDTARGIEIYACSNG